MEPTLHLNMIVLSSGGPRQQAPATDARGDRPTQPIMRTRFCVVNRILGLAAGPGHIPGALSDLDSARRYSRLGPGGAVPESATPHLAANGTGAGGHSHAADPLLHGPRRRPHVLGGLPGVVPILRALVPSPGYMVPTVRGCRGRSAAARPLPATTILSPSHLPRGVSSLAPGVGRGRPHGHTPYEPGALSGALPTRLRRPQRACQNRSPPGSGVRRQAVVRCLSSPHPIPIQSHYPQQSPSGDLHHMSQDARSKAHND